MKIGLIGRGRVAQALRANLGNSHDVRLGARDPGGDDEMQIAAVADWSDVVILAMPWSAEAEVAQVIAPHVNGKTIIDATNPAGMTKKGLGLVGPDDTSAAEALQALLPDARVVKSFNQIGAEFMAAPGQLATKPVMFAAGDDDTAREATLRLVADAGFEAVDAGPLSNARLLEALAMLWIWSAVKGPLGRTFGFSIAHKSE